MTSSVAKIAVLSDLHIRRSDSPVAKALVRLLRDLRTLEHPSELWLLGDIFDLLIGPYPFWLNVYAEIFDELRALQKTGCRILWIEGNHDFHFAQAVAEIPIEVLDGEIELSIEGRKVFLSHGDLVNQDDKSYQKWRATTRDPSFRKRLSRVPSILAQLLLRPFAEAVSRRSRKYSGLHELDLKNMHRSFARSKFDAGFDAVFMGHCHVEDLFFQGQHFYLNLGSALDGTLRYGLWNPASEPFPKVLLYPKIDG